MELIWGAFHTQRPSGSAQGIPMEVWGDWVVGSPWTTLQPTLTWPAGFIFRVTHGRPLSAENFTTAVAWPELSLGLSAAALQYSQNARQATLFESPDLRFAGLSPLPIPVLLTWSMLPIVVYNMSDILIYLMLLWRSLPLFQEPQRLSSGRLCILPKSLALPHMCTSAHPNHFLSISSAPTWVPCSPITVKEGWNDHITQ